MTQQYNSYGRDQYIIDGITGNVHFTQSPTGQELFGEGLKLLNQRAYKQAARLLSDAIKIDSSLLDAYYYLALSLLGGKKPQKVDEWTIRDVEEYLNLAIQRDTQPGRCYVLLAIVKHGFYKMNGFIEKPPISAQLFGLGESIQLETAKEILYHLDDPKNPYWLHLFKMFGESK